MDAASWLYVQAYFNRLPGFNLKDVPDIVAVHFAMANALNEAANRQFAQYKNELLRQMKVTRSPYHHE